MVSFLKRLFGVTKSTEERNEQNYIENKEKVLCEADEFRNEHKQILEFQNNTPVENIRLRDLIFAGFLSDRWTRKHLEEVMKEGIC